MLQEHQNDYKQQDSRVSDPRARDKGSLREHGSNLLLGQNDILHGILLALEILRFVVCVGREEEFCQEERTESEGVLIGNIDRRTSSLVERANVLSDLPWFQSKPCEDLTQLTYGWSLCQIDYL